MKRITLALCAAAVALTGCSEPQESAAPTESTSPNSAPADAEPGSAEQVDPKTWYAENCPAQLVTFGKSGGDDLYLAQGAVTYSPDMQRFQPRLWRYDQVSMVATPIQMADETFTFCFKRDAAQTKAEYQGEEYEIVAVTSPAHPEAAGYYVDRPPFAYFNFLDRLESDHVARIVNEELTPISDDARSSATTLDEYAPGDGPG